MIKKESHHREHAKRSTSNSPSRQVQRDSRLVYGVPIMGYSGIGVLDPVRPSDNTKNMYCRRHQLINLMFRPL